MVRAFYTADSVSLKTAGAIADDELAKGYCGRIIAQSQQLTRRLFES